MADVLTLEQAEALAERVSRAHELLEAAMRDIDQARGDVEPGTWGTLLAVLELLDQDAAP